MKSKTYITLLTILFSTNFLKAQWQEVTSLIGGNADNIQMDNNILYSNIAGYGFVFSTDSGYKWNKQNNNFAPNSDLYFKIENSIIIGTSGGYGTQLSTDGGNAFNALTIPYFVNSSDIYKGRIILVISYNPGVGIYTSLDSGQTWVNFPIANGISFLEKTDNRIFALSNGGEIYSTPDSGVTWNLLSSSGVQFIKSFKAKSDSLFLISTFYDKMKLSINNGASWNDITHPSKIDNYSNPVIEYHNDTLYFINSDSIFSSADLGATWKFEFYYRGLNATGIVFINNKLLISSANYGFIEVDLLNATGVVKSNDIHCVLIQDIKSNGDTLIIANNHNAIFYSYNNGIDWNTSVAIKNQPMPGRIAMDANNTFVSYNSQVFKSTNSGKSWAPFTLLFGVNNMITYKDSIFYATKKGVFGGPQLGGNNTKIGSLSKDVYDIAILQNRIMAVSKDNIRSADLTGYPIWNITSSGIPNPQKYAKVCQSDTAFFVYGFKGVYRCYPPNYNWTYTGLYHKFVYNVVTKNNQAFCVTEMKGICTLRNFVGSKWDPINWGLPYKNNMYTIAASDSDLFAGSHTIGGLWKRQLNDAVVTSNNEELQSPSEFMLNVYPNPCYSNLNFELSSSNDAQTVSMYNEKGDIVFEKSYNHSSDLTQQINVSKMATGFYLMELKAGGKVYSSKINVMH